METRKSNKIVFLEINWQIFLHPPIKIALLSKRIRHVLSSFMFHTLQKFEMLKGTLIFEIFTTDGSPVENISHYYLKFPLT